MTPDRTASTGARPSSEEGQRRIIAAAGAAFAARGFEGASLRTISASAGVLHTAMLYHFRTKDVLWRAVIEDLFADLDRRTAAAMAAAAGSEPLETMRAQLRAFIHFCAERPELHRIMTNEACIESPRLEWLVETFTARMFRTIARLSESLPIAPVFNHPIRLYYAIIGLATAPFTLAPEFRRLSGLDPFAPEEVERTIAVVEALVFRLDETAV
jgi:TetR/AcrR family transcriptional regulator